MLSKSRGISTDGVAWGPPAALGPGQVDSMETQQDLGTWCKQGEVTR